jgi:hypothetical protein
VSHDEIVEDGARDRSVLRPPQKQRRRADTADRIAHLPLVDGRRGEDRDGGRDGTVHTPGHAHALDLVGDERDQVR